MSSTPAMRRLSREPIAATGRGTQSGGGGDERPAPPPTAAAARGTPGERVRPPATTAPGRHRGGAYQQQGGGGVRSAGRGRCHRGPGWGDGGGRWGHGAEGDTLHRDVHGEYPGYSLAGEALGSLHRDAQGCPASQHGGGRKGP